MEKRLRKKWQEYLAGRPETGMAYQVVNLVLDDGTKVEDVVIIQSSLIGEIKGGDPGINPEKIADIEVTHRKYR